MGHKKINKLILSLMENCKNNHHRSLFFILGNKSRNQVVYLHHLLLKTSPSFGSSILWCFKKKLEFKVHNDKLIRSLKKTYQAQNVEMSEDILFNHFLVSTEMTYCHYSETDTVLGQTFAMAILQDFDGLTPNILARIMETVAGGGAIVFLLPNLKSLDDLASEKMNAHIHYATEAYPIVSLRFNKRFVQSLRSCKTCLVLDDELKKVFLHNNVATSKVKPQFSNNEELSALKQSQKDIKYVKRIIDQCCTCDQAKALLTFSNSLLEVKSHSVTVLTSARGRGKSSTLGLAIALAVALKYSNIFITSPHIENLRTLFAFMLKGLALLKYKEDVDFHTTYSTDEKGSKLFSQIEVFKSHHQIVKYISPTDASHLHNADLVVIDEAAAIPLPLVKNLLGPFKIFMASTINGYEGTGRSLSLKLISHLQKQSVSRVENEIYSPITPFKGHSLCEITLKEPIRYGENDSIEEWLNNLLCLDAVSVPSICGECPHPSKCQLYYVDRDVLFSYRKGAETFLQNAVALFVSSHYKNSPNDLLMMADAPAHHIFCLLPPIDDNACELPPILCIIQVALEGRILKPVILKEKTGKRGAGDLIPWLISQQFLDDDFPSYSGARIVRIATHPEFQRMGYGLRALQILSEYYKGFYIGSNTRMNTLQAQDKDSRKKDLLPFLLHRLEEREPEMLDYVGVSYGLTFELLRFWKKAGFVPLYVRQTQNELTGEHSCVMIKELSSRLEARKCLLEYWLDFSERYISLMSSAFRNVPVNLACAILTNNITGQSDVRKYSSEEMDTLVSHRSRNRLKMYSKHQVDYHLILDIIPTIAKMYFSNHLNLSLPFTQGAILLCLGLQGRFIEEAAAELNLQIAEALKLLMQLVKKFLCIYDKLESSTIMAEKKCSKRKPNPIEESKLDNNRLTNFNKVTESLKTKESFKGRSHNLCLETIGSTKKAKFF